MSRSLAADESDVSTGRVPPGFEYRRGGPPPSILNDGLDGLSREDQLQVSSTHSAPPPFGEGPVRPHLPDPTGLSACQPSLAATRGVGGRAKTAIVAQSSIWDRHPNGTARSGDASGGHPPSDALVLSTRACASAGASAVDTLSAGADQRIVSTAFSNRSVIEPEAASPHTTGFGERGKDPSAVGTLPVGLSWVQFVTRRTSLSADSSERIFTDRSNESPQFGCLEAPATAASPEKKRPRRGVE